MGWIPIFGEAAAYTLLTLQCLSLPVISLTTYAVCGAFFCMLANHVHVAVQVNLIW